LLDAAGDVKDIEDAWFFLHSLFEQIWNHRFLYRDLNNLLSGNRHLETHFHAVLERKTHAFRLMLESLAGAGLMRIDPDSIETLSASMSVMVTYWLSYEYVRNPRQALEKMNNYGALFLGEGTCVSYGDKVIGTNHVLPTRGAARYTGGLWVGKYLRTVTYQEVTNRESSAFFGEVCGRASRVERFEGHARSGDVRAAKYAGKELPWSEHKFGK
jgi:hypothetical protein